MKQTYKWEERHPFCIRSFATGHYDQCNGSNHYSV